MEFVGIAVLVIIAALAVKLSMHTFLIAPWEHGALYRDGGFERLLPPGKHHVFGSGRGLYVHRISTAPQYVQIGPVEVVTADRQPIRLSATVVYEVTDILASLSQPLAEPVRLSVSQTLTAFAARHTLDELLARTTADGEPLRAEPEAVAAPARITDLVLAGVVMPPELRRAVTEVERARLEGQAALERARGEHAALRSLANAARLLKDNPELMNLRVLQAVGTAGKGATLVIGDGALARSPTGGQPAAVTSSGSNS
jgi:regulator of protease activity HflC (stomatin/prohibitin superfamily)